MITSKEIQAFILRHWLVEHHCPFVISNFSGYGFHEADALVVTKAGIVTEFEIKVSRADFRADFKKTAKHALLSAGGPQEGDLASMWAKIPNYFYYAVPKGLLNANEVPEYAGLIEFTKFRLATEPGKEFVEFQYVKKAPRLHKLKAEQDLLLRIGKTLSARMVLGCALLTYNNRKAQGVSQ